MKYSKQYRVNVLEVQYLNPLTFLLAESINLQEILEIVSTVNSPLTDTLVSGQLYLRTLFTIPLFTSQSNSVFTHSRERTLSRKRARTLLKIKN